MRKMKDSGVEWLGEVPEEWDLRQAGQLAEQTKTPNDGMAETNLLSLSYGKVTRRDINSADGLLPASFETYNIIEPDDIVLRFTDLQNDQKSLRVGRATERGIITSAYVTVRPHDSTCSRFVYYALHAYDLRKGFYGMGAGVRQGLKWQEAKYIKLPWPGKAERSRIADFLDAKCAEIDRAVSAAEQSIQEYKAYFLTTVDEAFAQSKGFAKLSRVTSLVTDGDHQAPARTDHGIPFLVISNISGGTISFEDTDYVSEGYYERIPRAQRAREGDLLVSVTGSYGIPVLVNTTERFCFQRHIALVRPTISPVYLRFAMLTSKFKAYCDGVVTGAAQKTLTLTALKAAPIPKMSDADARLLVDRLQHEENEINAVLSVKQAIIDELKSYKKSLIYEVVTGKREV